MSALFNPGVYAPAEISAEAYHRDPAVEPSLSSSLARVIVEETPKRAWLAHPRLNPDFVAEEDGKFDLGSAVHDTLASDGKRIRIVEAADWRSKEAKQQRDDARAAGLIPLLTHQAEETVKIASAATWQAVAAGIALGKQEHVFIAQDRGAWVRAMIDGFSPPWISDWKISSINLANDDGLGRHLAESGYDLRAYFYLRVAELLFPDWAGRLKYRWLFVQKDSPYGLRVIECDGAFKEMGRRKYEHALGLWTRCMKSGEWPNLEGLPSTVPYPNFQENQWLAREEKPGFMMGPVEMLGRLDAGTL